MYKCMPSPSNEPLRRLSGANMPSTTALLSLFRCYTSEQLTIAAALVQPNLPSCLCSATPPGRPLPPRPALTVLRAVLLRECIGACNAEVAAVQLQHCAHLDIRLCVPGLRGMGRGEQRAP